MGIHEVMPPGFIHHGSAGSEYPCLIIVFHSPVKVLVHNEWVSAHNRMVVWNYEAEHEYGNSDQEWNHSWIRVSGKWMIRHLHNSTVPLGIPLNVGGDSLPMHYLTWICEELRNRPQQDPDMLEGLLQIFWHDISRHLKGEPYAPLPNTRLDRARKFIEENFARPFSLAEVAAQAHLSPAYFCSAFSKQFGIPPRDYATQLRLQRSTQLLANPELPIFQIAEMVGCTDPLYFSRLFHKRYGMSPREFRSNSN